MHFDERREGDVLVLVPRDESLDAYSAPELRNALGARIEQGWRCIVLDLEYVRFLDSTGLGALVSAYKRVAATGTMVLCGVDVFVLDVFRLTRMDEVFPLETSVEAAIARCRAARRAA